MHKQRILVADDHALLRRVISLTLKREGYEVVMAASGREAADCFRKQADGFDLTILDIWMPEMNGHETFRLLTRWRPEAKFLVVSGAPDPKWTKTEPADRNRQSTDHIAYLPKPFRAAQLVDAVRAILRDTPVRLSATGS